MSNIYNTLNNLFKKPLHQVAKKINYSQSNIYILENEFSKLKTDYPQIWNALLSCKHNKDKRTYEEYAKDLVSSWIYEDILLGYLQKNDFEIYLNGSDYKREILSTSKVMTDSDYLIKKDNIQRNVELVNSYTNYWKITNKIDLRDNKFLKMKKNKVLLLCIDLYNNIFYLLDFNFENFGYKYLDYHKPYGKPAYQIDIKNQQKYTFSINNLIKILSTFLK